MKRATRKRVRMYRCPYCNAVSPLQRRTYGDTVGLSACRTCFRGVLNHEVESWLEVVK